MNIGFYGHSNCAYRSAESFIDIISLKLNANIVNHGVKQGSEERILFELKKSKNINIAVIFHCLPQYMFLPECDRDIDTNSFKKSRAEDIFRNDHLDMKFVAENFPKFKKLFETNENLYHAINCYRTYFYHPDLIMNRFYGSLIQIDQYVTSKNIFAIHVLDNKRNILPPWFNFTSGIVNYSIMDIVRNNPATNPFFVNCITRSANKLVADEIVNIIAARDREVKCA